MGFLTKLFSGKSEGNAKPEEAKTTNSQPNTIYAPFKGTVIPLEQINDWNVPRGRNCLCTFRWQNHSGD